MHGVCLQFEEECSSWGSEGCSVDVVVACGGDLKQVQQHWGCQPTQSVSNIQPSQVSNPHTITINPNRLLNSLNPPKLHHLTLQLLHLHKQTLNMRQEASRPLLLQFASRHLAMFR